MRRFYAPPESFDASGVSLDIDETRHLRDVLRLKAGDEVSVFDGEGHEFLCLIGQINKSSTALEVLKETGPTAPESNLELTLAAGILKNEKFDLIIQKAVELGVNNFFPIMTTRCDVKIRDTEKRLERWRKIVLEASKQCGRATLMSISEPSLFKTFISGSQSGHLVLFSERDGDDFSSINAAKKMTALIGPEGGWDDGELEFAGARDLTIVTLGGRILRGETAAISVAAILQHRFGDMN